MQIANVLCPIDFSEFSRRALDHAAAVARWYDARLTALYVSVPTATVDALAVTGEGDVARLEAEMNAFVAPLPTELRIEVRVQESTDVHREILAQARALNADLLVIGSHGRSGFERLLLGSVTEKILHKAPCPTMVVPPRAKDKVVEEPVQFRRILTAVDFSAASADALALAVSLAKESDAHLTALHVIEVPPELRDHADLEAFSVDRIRAAAEADCLRRLREMIPADARTYCTIETAVREGAAYREILRAAGEGAADLIVMGVHGRRALDLMVFGSNTARVTRAAVCPVLTVPR